MGAADYVVQNWDTIESIGGTVADVAGDAWEEVSSWGWAEVEAKARSEGWVDTAVDVGTYVVHNWDTISDIGGTVVDVAGDAWDEVSSWGWAEVEAKARKSGWVDTAVDVGTYVVGNWDT